MDNKIDLSMFMNFLRLVNDARSLARSGDEDLSEVAADAAAGRATS
jgi:hypothetical protein